MTDTSLFAQYTLLNYLQGANNWKTVSDILSHLHEFTDWGDAQLGKQLPDRGLRNLQNWLKAIRESPEFSRFIQSEEDPDNRKQLLYKASNNGDGDNAMPIEDACFVLMAETFLDATLPTEFYEASLQALFTRAKSRLMHYEKSLAPGKRAIRSYLKRITITPRGQQLVKQPTPHHVLSIIYKAILDKRCVKMRYRGKPRQVHPYAVVIREPKIYLLGVDDKTMVKDGPQKARPSLYLCTRIEKPALGSLANRVPDDFKAEEYIQQGGLDVMLREEMALAGRAFTLKLRIYVDDDNLLQDLAEFPLSNRQTIEPEPGTGNHLLSASGMHASYQLVEWILGRMERVEVLAPAKLRDYIAEHIAKMHMRYLA